MDIKALLDKHRVKAGFVGGALVVSTAYGSCQFKPEAPAEEPAAEEPAAEEPKAEEPAKEEKAAEAGT